MFEKSEIGIPCPKCGHENNKTVAWLKSNDAMVCAGCGETVSIDSKQLVTSIDKAEKATAKFRKSLGRLGKRR